MIFLSLAFRYPHSPHQLGADGYFNNVMAKFIVEDGHANWILSVFSFTGLGPFSYPAAIHFMVASISQLANIPIEESVLYLNIIIGICGVLFSFMMMKELTKNNEIALISSFIFSTTPEFLRLTIWNGSSRSITMVFFLLLIFFLFKTQYAKRSDSHSGYNETIFTALTLITLIMVSTIHRMWIFAIFIIIGYMLARPIYGVKRMIKIRTGMWKEKKHTFVSGAIFLLWVSVIVTLIYVQLNNIWFYDGMNLWYKYQSGQFFMGTSFEYLLLNMIIDYVSGYGILSIFFIAGALYMFKRRNKTYGHIFLASSIFFIAPIATLGIYSKLILILFITPLIGFGIYWFLSLKLIKKVALPMLIIILLATCGFSVFMTNHWQDSSGGDYMTESQADVGMYVKYNLEVNDTYVTNNQVFGNMVLSVADCHFLTETFPYPLIFGWVEKQDIVKLLDWETMVEEYSIEINYPEELAVTMDHRQIILYHIDTSEYERNLYNVNYAVVNEVSTSNFYIESSLYDTRYIIFDNTEGRVWYLG